MSVAAWGRTRRKGTLVMTVCMKSESVKSSLGIQLVSTYAAKGGYEYSICLSCWCSPAQVHMNYELKSLCPEPSLTLIPRCPRPPVVVVVPAVVGVPGGGGAEAGLDRGPRERVRTHTPDVAVPVARKVSACADADLIKWDA